MVDRTASWTRGCAVEVNLEIRSEGERLDTTSRNGLLVGVVVLVGDWMREEEGAASPFVAASFVVSGDVEVVIGSSLSISFPSSLLEGSSFVLVSVSKLMGKDASLISARARFKLSDSELDLRGSKKSSIGPLLLLPPPGGGRLLSLPPPPPPPTLDMDR